MTDLTAAKSASQTPARRKIPDYLVREVVDGVKFYYPGYRSVLNKTKTLEDIMPESVFQGSLKTQIGFFLNAHLDAKKFRILIGESGVHISYKVNLGLEIAVYDKSILTREKITDAYSTVPAELVVEIDLNVEPEDKQKDLFNDFVIPKTQRLLDFGTKKVVWYFSKTRKVMIATPGKSWTFQDWSTPVDLMPGLSLDIIQLLAGADIALEDGG